MTKRYGFVVEADSRVADGSPHGADGRNDLSNAAPGSLDLSPGLDAALAVNGPMPSHGKGFAHRGRRQSALVRLITWCLIIAALVGAFGYFRQWWALGRFLESTNDGYVKAD